MIYGNSVDLFNLGHAKFLTRFANEDQQREIVEKVRKRINRPNPLDSGLSFPFEIEQCPDEDDDAWRKYDSERGTRKTYKKKDSSLWKTSPRSNDNDYSDYSIWISDSRDEEKKVEQKEESKNRREDVVG